MGNSDATGGTPVPGGVSPGADADERAGDKDRISDQHVIPEGSVRCPHCDRTHPRTWSHCPIMGKPLTMGPALVGRVIAGRYEIRGILGEGGMGAVYEALQLEIGRRVALKRLHPELATDQSAVRRFQREARAAGSTGHENVVDVLDLGFAEDGAPYLVMELLIGETLSARLTRTPQLSVRQTARIGGQVLAALQAVHRRGVIHRDLKPDNIFLTRRAGRRDYVKVLDFGVSKIATDAGLEAALTRTGVTVGTPQYMSPEQARGMKNLDHRVDLYAVGVILYRCLAGQLPLEADNYHALLQSILVREPARLTTLAPGVPRAFADCIHRALAKRPSGRFPDALTMWRELVPFGAMSPDAADSEIPPPAALGYAPTDMEIDSSSTTLDGTPPSFPALSEIAPLAEGTWPSDPPPAGAVHESGPARARPFVAVSFDWDADRAGPSIVPLPATGGFAPVPLPLPSHTPAAPSVRPSGTSQRPSGTSRRPSGRSLRPKIRTPSELGRVKGSVVLAARAFLKRSPGAFQRIESRLPDKHRVILHERLLPVAWLDAEHFIALLSAIEHATGTGDGARARTLGDGVARQTLPSSHKLLVGGANPRAAVERLPLVWRGYFDAAELAVDGTGSQAYRLRIDSGPDGQHFLCMMCGFAERMIALCGAREARVSIAASRERGDENSTLAIVYS